MSCIQAVHDLPKPSRRRRHALAVCTQCGHAFRLVLQDNLDVVWWQWIEWSP